LPLSDDVIEGHSLTDQQQTVLAYLESHPGEVFSLEDVDEMQAKMDAGTPASLGATLETLYAMGRIERQRVRARYFYGSREAIDRLRTRMTEAASRQGQREV
jgi:Fe2+ or Zn2+ uptake regulation protein